MPSAPDTSWISSDKTPDAPVSAMAAAVCIAVGWTTHKITRSDDDIRVLTQQAQVIRDDANRMRSQRDAALTEAEQARIAQAQTAGHLEAVAETAKKPDIRPT